MDANGVIQNITGDYKGVPQLKTSIHILGLRLKPSVGMEAYPRKPPPNLAEW